MKGMGDRVIQEFILSFIKYLQSTSNVSGSRFHHELLLNQKGNQKTQSRLGYTQLVKLEELLILLGLNCLSD